MAIDKQALDELRIDRSGDEQPSRTGRVILIAIILMIVAAIVWGITARPGATVVTVAEAERVSTGADGGSTVLNANGYVTARRAATVSSEVTGRVTEVLIEEGMVVEQGQILARIDAATPEAALQLSRAQARAAESALRETRVRIDEARLDLQRAERLTRDEVASQQDLDRARASLAALEARLQVQRDDLNVARRQIDLREADLADSVIRAPFSGVVVSKNAQEGEMISPMSAGGSFTRTGICTIVDMDSLEIEVDVNEAYINRVSDGQGVVAVLDAYPNWEIPSHVIAVIPTADRQKATVRVRIGIDVKDPRILPDMGVKVRFMAADEAGGDDRTTLVAIPKEALRRDGEADVVFVASDGTAERRAVNVASTEGDRAMVRAGLVAGERVVVTADGELGDGMRITIREGE